MRRAEIVPTAVILRIPGWLNADVLDDPQQQCFDQDGFVVLEHFAPEICDAMYARVVEIARRAETGDDVSPAFVMPEANLRGRPGTAEELVSKIFRLHRDKVFGEFAARPDLLDAIAMLLATDDVDCFLSQFIFKNPGAWGQPCHQDSWYFPFEPARPVVGAWLAITQATLQNGCLHVVSGSHREPVHEHVPDRRPNANYGYVEIIDHNLSSAVPVLLEPGDLLLFDSHLMHFSTDNVSNGVRAAMVYHYARAGTVDRTEELRGYTINDWLPMRRSP
jgi:ectoine hydroxylase-related dioxygenase (phytanoyl-CoA dioxygenase family)